jgi:hypothetical protein
VALTQRSEPSRNGHSGRARFREGFRSITQLPLRVVDHAAGQVNIRLTTKAFAERPCVPARRLLQHHRFCWPRASRDRFRVRADRAVALPHTMEAILAGVTAPSRGAIMHQVW